MGTLHEDQYTFLSYLARFFLEWEMFETEVEEEIQTHFRSVIFFENHCVYGIIL
jgi:hypothetical protein